MNLVVHSLKIPASLQLSWWQAELIEPWILYSSNHKGFFSLSHSMACKQGLCQNIWWWVREQGKVHSCLVQNYYYCKMKTSKLNLISNLVNNLYFLCTFFFKELFVSWCCIFSWTAFLFPFQGQCVDDRSYADDIGIHSWDSNNL